MKRHALAEAVQSSGFTRREVTDLLGWPRDRLSRLIAGARFEPGEPEELAQILGRFIHELYDRSPLEEAYWTDTSEDRMSARQNGIWWRTNLDEQREKNRERRARQLGV